MAWNDDYNHSAGLMGANIEYGDVTLAAGTAEIPTRMSKIYALILTPKENLGRALSYWSDLVITAGCVTAADGSLAAGAYTYVLVGRM